MTGVFFLTKRGSPYVPVRHQYVCGNENMIEAECLCGNIKLTASSLPISVTIGKLNDMLIFKHKNTEVYDGALVKSHFVQVR